MKIICYLILLMSALVFLAGCNTNNDNTNIGGQKDENGCLIPAGYAYNKEANACIRDFEFDSDQKRAANIAVGYIGYANGITVTSVVKQECDGCFVVEVEKNNERMKVSITNWSVSEAVLI
jgi:hypothetical protein